MSLFLDDLLIFYLAIGVILPFKRCGMLLEGDVCLLGNALLLEITLDSSWFIMKNTVVYRHEQDEGRFCSVC